MKIIFVDDSKLVLMTLKVIVLEILNNNELRDKITCEFYNSSPELLEIAKNKEDFNFDLAFFDINMPQISGFDLTKEIRAIDKFKFKPIVAVTTEVSSHAKLKGKEAGFSAWLVKTASHKVIKDTLGKIIRKIYSANN